MLYPHIRSLQLSLALVRTITQKDALCNNVRKLPGAMDEGDIEGVIPCWVLPTHRDSEFILGQHSDKYFIVKRKAESSAKGTVILKAKI